MEVPATQLLVRLAQLAWKRALAMLLKLVTDMKGYTDRYRCLLWAKRSGFPLQPPFLFAPTLLPMSSLHLVFVLASLFLYAASSLYVSSVKPYVLSCLTPSTTRPEPPVYRCLGGVRTLGELLGSGERHFRSLSHQRLLCQCCQNLCLEKHSQNSVSHYMSHYPSLSSLFKSQHVASSLPDRYVLPVILSSIYQSDLPV